MMITHEKSVQLQGQGMGLWHEDPNMTDAQVLEWAYEVLYHGWNSGLPISEAVEQEERQIVLLAYKKMNT